MQITQIEVTYSYTYNMGDYSNVRPSIKVTAQLEAPDNDAEIRRELMQSARTQVEVEIDRALEHMGRPPEFYPGPRYVLLISRMDRLAVLVKKDEKRDLPDPWPKLIEKYRGHRREYILGQYVEKLGRDHQLIEPVNGDYSGLPKLAYLCTVIHEDEKLLVVLPGSFSLEEIGSRGEGWRWVFKGSANYCLPGAKLARAQAEAKERGLRFIDASDGDLEKLPYLEPDVEVQTEPDDDPLYDLRFIDARD